MTPPRQPVLLSSFRNLPASKFPHLGGKVGLEACPGHYFC